jgi:hypothetical protein
MYPSNQQIMRYVEKMGERGKKTLSILGKKQDFIVAINTKIGEELMGDLIEMHESLLVKIATLSATDEDKADYKAVGKLLGIFASKVADYEGKIREIIYVANKERKE